MGHELAPLSINPDGLAGGQTFGEFMLAHAELLGMDLALRPGIEAGSAPSDIVPDTDIQTPFGTEQMIGVDTSPLISSRGSNSLVGQLICNDD